MEWRTRFKTINIYIFNILLGDCMFILYGFSNISAIPVEKSKTPFFGPFELLVYFLWLISDRKAIL
jgi:hypothetical protein